MARVKGGVRGERAGAGSQELARLSPCLGAWFFTLLFRFHLAAHLEYVVGMYLRSPSPSIDPEVETSLRFAFPSLCLVS
jgi:hypothetical protein